MKRLIGMALMLAAACCAPALAQEKVRFAVGGKSAVFYLPLSVTERLGYFKEQGLDVDYRVFPSGTTAFQTFRTGQGDIVMTGDLPSVQYFFRNNGNYRTIAAIERDANSIRDYSVDRATRLVVLKLVGYTETVHAVADRLSDESSVVLFGGRAKDRPYPGSTTVATVNGAVNTVTNTYSYNRRRLMTQETMARNATTQWYVDYTYDANGNLLLLGYPSALSVDYAPNALGQPTKAGTYATGVTYFPNGAIKQFTYGNGIVHTLTQNARGLPDTSKDAYSTTSFLNDGYDYDANGNVAAITDGATGTGQRGNRTMTYDGLDRLKTVASPMFGAPGANYTYDVLDNLTRVNVGGVAARDHYYCYDTAWRLTNVKTGSCAGTSVIGLGYDPQGNLNNKNGVAYTFDYGNRLRVVSGQESYLYDAYGRRVQANKSGGSYIVSQYSQSGQLLYQQDYRKAQREEYVYLGSSLVANLETPHAAGSATVVKYQHTDALGSPVVVTDAARVVLERNEYEPYGKVIAPASPQDGPGYTGHVFDAATGMNYMQQRYYDPSIGRTLSVDPVTAYDGDMRHFNRYAYAYNNPYRFTDLDGRKPGDPFKTPEAAAKDAIKSINPTSKKQNREYGGEVYKGKDGKFRATTPVKGTVDGVNPHNSPAPKGTQTVGDYHTHGEYSQVDAKGNVTVTGNPKQDSFNSDHFSSTDKQGITADAQGKAGYKGYLGTPGGKVLQFDPKTQKETEVK